MLYLSIFPKVQDSDFRKVLNVEKDKYEKNF